MNLHRGDIEDRTVISPLSTKHLSLAKELLAMRGRRRDFVSPDLLGEPAWDLMLALFVASIEQRRTTVSEIVLASGAPPTTALRWVELLQQRGIIRRVASPHDTRVIYLFIMPQGIDQMTAFLEDAAQSLACVAKGCVGK